MAAQLFLLPFRPALDANAIPVVGAQLFFYATGTSTPQPVYADEFLVTELPNPVEANAAGVWPAIYIDKGKTYRAVLRDENGAILDEVDPYVPGVVDNLAPQVAEDAAAASVSADKASGYALALLMGSNGYQYPDLATAIADPDNPVGNAFLVVPQVSEDFDGTAFIGYNDGLGGKLVVEFLTSAAFDAAGTTLTITQAGDGAVPRTIQDKTRDIASVKDFGAIGDGTLHTVAEWIVPNGPYASLSAVQAEYPHVTATTNSIDWVAFQAAIDSGAPAVFVPRGNYQMASLLMPMQPGFEIYGEGRGSNLLHMAGTGPVFRWPENLTGVNFLIQAVRNMQFSCENGTSHTVDTSYAGNINLRDLYFSNTPVSFSNIYINGSVSVFTHDVRLCNIEILSSTPGDAGITIGPKCADIEIKQYTFNGTFNVNYALKLQAGPGSVYVSDSHIYNAKLNVVLANGMSDPIVFDNVCFDNAIEDLVFITNSAGTMFDNCRFQQIRVGKYGLSNSGGSGSTLTGCRFDGAVGAAGCVRDISGAVGTNVTGGYVATPANFTTPFPSGAIVRLNNAKNPGGYTFGYSGVTDGGVAAGLARFLGATGAKTTIEPATYLCPHAGTVTKARIDASVAPGASQSFGFIVYVDDVSSGTGSITGSGFSVSIPLSAPVVEGSRVSIRLDTSAGAASSDFRYFVAMEG